MIPRIVEKNINIDFNRGKVIHLPGARQVGKTTLLKHLADNHKGQVVWMNGDEADVREIFADFTSGKAASIIGKSELIIIDEAQRIPEAGLCLKLIVDAFPSVQVIASGSSAFELASKINEPLTGRKIEHFLYPFSFQELVNHQRYMAERRLIEHRLVFGYYPEVVMNQGEEESILRRLSESYLYKDVFILEGIKKPQLVDKLVQALAHQVGNEVNANELGQLIGADHKTVERYIDLLEKAYIIFRLPSLSRNVRNEIKKGRKIYFYDNGLRNAIIKNFNPVSLRNDIGALWENFLISERIKANSFSKHWVNAFFWRTHNQQEIDYIEEYGGKLHAYEFKWRPKKVRVPKVFDHSYDMTYQQINRENFESFIGVV